MTVKSTKREIQAYLQYRNTPERSLKDCYKKFSYGKEKAEAYIVDLMLNKYDGYGYKVLSYTTEHFSAGFIGVYNGQKCFFYFTHAKETVTPLETKI